MLTEFEKLLNENQFEFSKGSIINVIVSEITNKSVIVDLNFKSKATIDIEEFKDFNGQLSIDINQEISVLIEQLDDGEGNTILSYAKAQEKVNQKNIQKSLEEDDFYIQVIGKKMVNKGYVASYNGIDVFIPFSLLDIKKENNFDFLNNTKFFVKVIKCDFSKNSIFASRKYYIEKELGINVENEFLNIKKGDVIKGKVKTFMKYGVFIDIGFTDSLLHLNDISWKKINNPSEVFSENDSIEVIVTEVDLDNKRIYISLRELNQKPWKLFKTNVNEGDTIDVSISQIQSSGIIVSYNDNIEFFIHYSELSWVSLKGKIETEFSIGQSISVIVNSINHNKKDVNLKLLNKSENPIMLFDKTHSKGDILQATVIDKGNNFLRIKLNGNVSGYLFGDEISWNFDSMKLLSNFEKGQKISVAYKSFDSKNKLLNFSIKDLLPNPFLDFKNLKKGDLIPVTIIDLQKNLIIVETSNGARSLIQNTLSKNYNNGDRLTLKFKSANNNSIELYS